MNPRMYGPRHAKCLEERNRDTRTHARTHKLCCNSTCRVLLLQVKLGPRPWHERWERQELKGVEDLGLPERFYKRAAEVAKPWQKHDLMRDYRLAINEDETEEIMTDVYGKMQGIETQQKLRRRQGPGPAK